MNGSKAWNDTKKVAGELGLEGLVNPFGLGDFMDKTLNSRDYNFDDPKQEDHYESGMFRNNINKQNDSNSFGSINPPINNGDNTNKPNFFSSIAHTVLNPLSLFYDNNDILGSYNDGADTGSFSGMAKGGYLRHYDKGGNVEPNYYDFELQPDNYSYTRPDQMYYAPQNEQDDNTDDIGNNIFNDLMMMYLLHGGAKKEDILKLLGQKKGAEEAINQKEIERMLAEDDLLSEISRQDSLKKDNNGSRFLGNDDSYTNNTTMASNNDLDWLLDDEKIGNSRSSRGLGSVYNDGIELPTNNDSMFNMSDKAGEYDDLFGDNNVSRNQNRVFNNFKNDNSNFQNIGKGNYDKFADSLSFSGSNLPSSRGLSSIDDIPDFDEFSRGITPSNVSLSGIEDDIDAALKNKYGNMDPELGNILRNREMNNLKGKNLSPHNNLFSGKKPSGYEGMNESLNSLSNQSYDGPYKSTWGSAGVNKNPDLFNVEAESDFGNFSPRNATGNKFGAPKTNNSSIDLEDINLDNASNSYNSYDNNPFKPDTLEKPTAINKLSSSSAKGGSGLNSFGLDNPFKSEGVSAGNFYNNPVNSSFANSAEDGFANVLNAGKTGSTSNLFGNFSKGKSLWTKSAGVIDDGISAVSKGAGSLFSGAGKAASKVNKSGLASLAMNVLPMMVRKGGYIKDMHHYDDGGYVNNGYSSYGLGSINSYTSPNNYNNINSDDMLQGMNQIANNINTYPQMNPMYNTGKIISADNRGSFSGTQKFALGGVANNFGKLKRRY